MGRIFISYRRAETGSHADHIYEHLVKRYGSDSVFLDVEKIEGGMVFSAAIANALASSNVLLAVIGKNWLEVSDKTGQRRIDRPDDYVRREIGAALERQIDVYPILVDGAQLPKPEDLPNDLQSLLKHQAVVVGRSPEFSNDMKKLSRLLDKYFRRRHFVRRSILALVFLILLGCVSPLICYICCGRDYLYPLIPLGTFIAETNKHKDNPEALEAFLTNKVGKYVKWECKILKTDKLDKRYHIVDPGEKNPDHNWAIADFSESEAFEFDKEPIDETKIIDGQLKVITDGGIRIVLEKCRFSGS